MTLQLLWEEYRAGAGEQAYRYSAFCEKYRAWVRRLNRSIRQIHPGGERLFVDYAGPIIPVVDASTGEIRRAQIFVAVLGASNYTYCERRSGNARMHQAGQHGVKVRFDALSVRAPVGWQLDASAEVRLTDQERVMLGEGFKFHACVPEELLDRTIMARLFAVLSSDRSAQGASPARGWRTGL